jgi:DNA repair exonuclease SbcCD ATPase subunit
VQVASLQQELAESQAALQQHLSAPPTSAVAEASELERLQHALAASEQLSAVLQGELDAARASVQMLQSSEEQLREQLAAVRDQEVLPLQARERDLAALLQQARDEVDTLRTGGAGATSVDGGSPDAAATALAEQVEALESQLLDVTTELEMKDEALQVCGACTHLVGWFAGCYVVR